MEISTLSTGLKVFMSREVTGKAGEDLVEKQNAEQGLMPVVEDEATLYGYVAENRHMVQAFLNGRAPEETFHDGVAVVEALMALYRSAETGRTVTLPDETLATFIPAVARPRPGAEDNRSPGQASSNGGNRGRSEGTELTGRSGPGA